MHAQGSNSRWWSGTLFLAAAWFGIATGLVEGGGLLLFQRINWARWGPMMHVSEEILWIAPLVDLLLFSLLTVFVSLLAGAASRNAWRMVVPTLAFLAAYDWLTLTARLSRNACLLLALGVAVAFGRWFGKHELAARQFWKKTAPLAILTFVLAFAGIQGEKWLRERSETLKLPPAAPGSPNVLCIVVDTLRADHVSSYGYSRPTSPNMDRIAAQGTLFENAVSTSSCKSRGAETSRDPPNFPWPMRAMWSWRRRSGCKML